MKKILTSLIAAWVLFSCSNTPGNDADKSTAAVKARAEANVELVKAFMKAFEMGEVEKWRELCSEDFVTLGPGYDDKATLQEYIESLAGFEDAVDSIKIRTLTILPYTVEEGEQAGDYVFWWGVNSGYYINAGKTVNIRLHTVFQIEDGKISWNADYWDTGDLVRQLSAGEEDKEEEIEGDEV